MFRKSKDWFADLSKGAQIGLVSILAITGIAVAGSGTDTPSPTMPKPVLAECSSVVTHPTETQTIPFTSSKVDDSSVAKGQTVTTTAGATGEKTITYTVTAFTPTGCKPDTKVQEKEDITKQSVNEVIAVGTKVVPPRPVCDPNYSGACVPIAYDVDCSSGSGNGPAYVHGPVTVIGSDIYGLDSDGDGVGCERG